MIRQATREDIPQINAILNEPSVKEGALFDADKPVDAADFFDIGFTLMANGGCFICIPIDQDSLDVHTNFLPEYRGENALSEAKSGLRMILTQTGIERVFTKVHEDAMATRKFAKWAGFEETLRSDKFIHYTLCLEKFVAMDEPLKALGAQKFPEAPVAAHGLLGFAWACSNNGLPWRGVTIYNRFATLCGWPLLDWDARSLAISLGGKIMNTEEIQNMSPETVIGGE